MKNGILYLFFKFIFDKLKYLSLVEGFKYIGQKFNPRPNDDDSKLIFERVSVDVFIILKWFLIFFLEKNHYSNNFCVLVVWYFLITNIYTYFYYHIWDDEALNTENFLKDRIRRRFINLMLAVSYSNLCFAYLYRNSYVVDYDWSEKPPTFIKSIWFSISNSLAANYEGVKPLTDFGNSISMIQLIITFIFVTIILGKSIPQTNSNI